MEIYKSIIIFLRNKLNTAFILVVSESEVTFITSIMTFTSDIGVSSLKTYTSPAVTV